MLHGVPILERYRDTLPLKTLRFLRFISIGTLRMTGKSTPVRKRCFNKCCVCSALCFHSLHCSRACSPSPLKHALAARACEKTSSMAASGSETAAAPRLVDKKDARSEMWKYCSYISDSEGKPTDTTRPVCKKCFRSLQTKGAHQTWLSTSPTGIQSCLKNLKTDRLANVIDNIITSCSSPCPQI